MPAKSSAKSATGKAGNGKSWPDPASAEAHRSQANASYPGTVATEHMLDSMAQMTAEIARFGAQRVHRLMEAQQEMLGCRTPDEVQKVQTAYLGGLMSDYAAEWSRLTHYAMRAYGGGLIAPPPEPEAGPEDRRGNAESYPV